MKWGESIGCVILLVNIKKRVYAFNG